MLPTFFAIWLTLFVIGVSDAQAHRIPNKFLVLLLVFISISILTSTHPDIMLDTFLDKSLAFVVSLVFGFVLYFLRIVAPGDVKLVAVIGFFLGMDGLSSYLFYVCLVSVFVGLMYWFLKRLDSETKEQKVVVGERGGDNFSLEGMVVGTQIAKQNLEKTILTGQGLTYMPLAPILVIGLALQHYYT